MNKEPVTHLGLKVPVSLKRKLEERAQADGRPTGAYVRRVLEAHVAAGKKR